MFFLLVGFVSLAFLRVGGRQNKQRPVKLYSALIRERVKTLYESLLIVYCTLPTLSKKKRAEGLPVILLSVVGLTALEYTIELGGSTNSVLPIR